MIIGISGGSGTGKTRFSASLAEAIGWEDCNIISQDSYYLDNSHLSMEERKLLNFDEPSRIDFELMVKQLDKLNRGEIISIPVYSFVECNRLKETRAIAPRPVTILEGIFLFHHRQLRDMMDFKVFLSADASVRLERIRQRDLSERGRSSDEVRERFFSIVEPMHRKYVEPMQIFADLDLEHIDTSVCIDEVLWQLNNHSA